MNFFEMLFAILVFYYCIISVLIIQKDMKVQKKLTVTRQEVKSILEEINNISCNNGVVTMDNVPWHNKYAENSEALYGILWRYNELAIGINMGIYDELYVKLTLKHQMMNFYKKHYHKLLINLERDTYIDPYTNFIYLELLLKKWDTENSSYDSKRLRRYR